MHRLFVSSTFRDMQAERDMLHRDVLPVINEQAAAFGDHVQMVDLRWGVNTVDLEGEEGSKQVLSVCLGEIDACRPWMIVFLGDRYGWIPGSELLSTSPEVRGLELDSLEMSVTALEIEYGALQGITPGANCIFCLREPLPWDQIPEPLRTLYAPEDEAHHQRVNALKERIRMLMGDAVISYTVAWDESAGTLGGLEDLAETLQKRLIQMLLPEWESSKKLSWQESEQLQFRMIMAERREHASPQTLDLTQCLADASNPDCDVLVVQAQDPQAVGDMLAALANAFEAQGDVVFHFLCGSTPRSEYLEDYYRQLHHFLLGRSSVVRQKTLDDEHGMTAAQLQNEAFLLLQLNQLKENSPRIVIVLDGFERFVPHPLLVGGTWLPQTYISLPNTFVLIGCQKDVIVSISGLSAIDTNLRVVTRELGNPDLETRREGIAHRLQAFGKQLSASVMNALLEKPGASKSIWVDMMLQRLSMMDEADFRNADGLAPGALGLDRQMQALIQQAPDTPTMFGVRLFKAAASRISPDACMAAVRFLAISRFGLRMDDLEALLHVGAAQAVDAFNRLDFTRYIRFMYRWFLLRPDGRIDFSSPTIREGFLAELGPDTSALHQKLLGHLATLPVRDPIVLEEGLYHAQKCVDTEYALSLLETRGDPYGLEFRNPLSEPRKGDWVSVALAEQLVRMSGMDQGAWLVRLFSAEAMMCLTHEGRINVLTFFLVYVCEVLLTQSLDKEISEALLRQVVQLSEQPLPAGATGREEAQWRLIHIQVLCQMGTLLWKNQDASAAYECFLDAEAAFVEAERLDVWAGQPMNLKYMEAASLRTLVGRACLAVGHLEPAQICFQEALDMRTMILEKEGCGTPELQDAISDALYWLGLVYRAQEKGNEALEAWRTSLAYLEAPEPDEDPLDGSNMEVFGRKMTLNVPSAFKKEYGAMSFRMIDEDWRDESRFDAVDALRGVGPLQRTHPRLIRIAELYREIGDLFVVGMAYARNCHLMALLFAETAEKSVKNAETRWLLSNIYYSLSFHYQERALMEERNDLLTCCISLGREAASWANREDWRQAMDELDRALHR